MSRINWLLARGGFGYMNEAGAEGSDAGAAGAAGAEGSDAGAAGAAGAEGAGAEGAGAEGAGAEGAGAEGAGAGAEGAGAEGADNKKKDFHVPIARLDASKQRANRERDRADAAEAEVERLKGGSGKVDTETNPNDVLDTKLSELDDKLDAAIADGDVKDAKAIRNEMRGVERQINKNYVNEQTSAASTAARNGSRADTLLANYEEAFPVINPDAPEYDETIMFEVAELKSGFVNSGKYSEGEALSKAVGYVLGESAAAAAAPAKREADINKNIDTHKRQPGAMGGEDNGANGMNKGLDAMKMSDVEFDKLSEEQVANLRGDNFSG